MSSESGWTDIVVEIEEVDLCLGVIYILQFLEVRNFLVEEVRSYRSISRRSNLYLVSLCTGFV